MTRINTNVPALMAVTDLARNNRDLATSLQRLSSGLQINRAADNPAGLIASEFLRAEIGGLETAIANSQRAINVITTAEGALTEVSALLVTIRQLVVEAANAGALSTEEIEANQLQVDSAVASITRIANATSFAGLKLLNGNLAYVTSGVAASAIQDVTVYSVQFGEQSSIPVAVNVIAGAATAELVYQASSITSSVTIEVAGNLGTEVFSFVSGTRISAILFAINQLTDSTGVSASLVSATDFSSGLSFNSVEYGSSQFVSVRALSGTFAISGGVERAVGTDAVASVNGNMALGDGLKLTVNTTSLDLVLTLSESFGTGTTNFTITGGGALFQLGADVSPNQQCNLGIQSITANNLGNGTVGWLNEIVTGGQYSLIAGRADRAQRIVDEAIADVATLRGRLGAFELNTLQTNINSLEVALENLTSAESNIRDTDFAKETSRLTRAQILVQANTSVLAIANANPQSVLALLQGYEL